VKDWCDVACCVRLQYTHPELTASSAQQVFSRGHTARIWGLYYYRTFLTFHSLTFRRAGGTSSRRRLTQRAATAAGGTPPFYLLRRPFHFGSVLRHSHLLACPLFFRISFALAGWRAIALYARDCKVPCRSAVLDSTCMPALLGGRTVRAWRMACLLRRAHHCNPLCITGFSCLRASFIPYACSL